MICLTLGVADFLTMLSDNIAMAQGLFRMLLTARQGAEIEWVTAETTRSPRRRRRCRSTRVEKALMLRTNPLLGRATVDQLLDLAAITREVRLASGDVLLTERGQPSVFHVLVGEIQLDNGGAPPILLGPGRTIGVAETLAGLSPRRRATVSREGHALRLDHDELFDVLSDHVDLLQGVFSGVLSAQDEEDEPRSGSGFRRLEMKRLLRVFLVVVLGIATWPAACRPPDGRSDRDAARPLETWEQFQGPEAETFLQQGADPQHEGIWAPA